MKQILLSTKTLFIFLVSFFSTGSYAICHPQDCLLGSPQASILAQFRFDAPAGERLSISPVIGLSRIDILEGEIDEGTIRNEVNLEFSPFTIYYRNQEQFRLSFQSMRIQLTATQEVTAPAQNGVTFGLAGSESIVYNIPANELDVKVGVSATGALDGWSLEMPLGEYNYSGNSNNPLVLGALNSLSARLSFTPDSSCDLGEDCRVSTGIVQTRSTPTQIPEPPSYWLLIAGLVAWRSIISKQLKSPP